MCPVIGVQPVGRLLVVVEAEPIDIHGTLGFLEGAQLVEAEFEHVSQ